MVFHLDEEAREGLLERFLRYVAVDTQSDEKSSSSPSTEKQKDLGRILEGELRELGCLNTSMDEHGYVYGSLGARGVGPNVPPLGFIAHMDTYPGTLGNNVKPNVLRPYLGGDIVLPGNRDLVLRQKDCPNLTRCIGHTVITTDGTTLLGADDKAGIAEIMTMLAWLQAHRDIPHGPIEIAFTPDEEIGRGTDHFDTKRFSARYAYTLDGSDLGEIEDETFCADSAIVVVQGYDVHPGYAKGKLKNAIRGAAAIVDRLPVEFLPETTEGRESYLHAIDIRGDVTKTEIRLILRAFTEDELRKREQSLRDTIAQVEKDFPGITCTVEIKESYRNMSYAIRKDPKVVSVAIDAIKRQGIVPVQRAIRGGTDGARLSFMGILTPNLWAGGQEFHSVREWVSLDWMAKSVETALQILQVWHEQAG